MSMNDTRITSYQQNCPQPNLFVPHPNLDDEINHNICQSEMEGGVSLDHLISGEIIEVQTRNRSYIIEKREKGEVLICGHPRFCPQPVLVKLNGSTWGGSMLKLHFIGRGMHMEFRHPIHSVILTSPVVEIRQLKQRPPRPPQQLVAVS